MMKNELFTEGTLSLARAFIEVSKAYELVSYASLLDSPRWWVSKRVWILRRYRESRLRSLSARRVALVAELSKRFEGLLFELFTQRSSVIEFGGYVANVWRQAQIEAFSMNDHRQFSAVLWGIQLGLGYDVKELRPKFMLRQFVDEMPAGSHRTTLSLLAYGGVRNMPFINREVTSFVKRAYPVLHQEVLYRTAELPILTDGELSPVLVNTFTEPFDQYHKWLFRWNEKSNESDEGDELDSQ